MYSVSHNIKTAFSLKREHQLYTHLQWSTEEHFKHISLFIAPTLTGPTEGHYTLIGRTMSHKTEIPFNSPISEIKLFKLGVWFPGLAIVLDLYIIRKKAIKRCVALVS